MYAYISFYLPCDVVLIFVGHQEVLDGFASFEVYLYPMFTSNVLQVLTRPFPVRYHHVDVDFFVVAIFGVAIDNVDVVTVSVVVFILAA